MFSFDLKSGFITVSSRGYFVIHQHRKYLAFSWDFDGGVGNQTAGRSDFQFKVLFYCLVLSIPLALVSTLCAIYFYEVI